MKTATLPTKTEKLRGQELVEATRGLRRRRFDRLRRIAAGDEGVSPERLDELLRSVGLPFETFEAWTEAGGVPKSATTADDAVLRDQLRKRRRTAQCEIEDLANKMPYAERELASRQNDLRSLKGEKGAATQFHQWSDSEKRAGIPVAEERIKTQAKELERLRNRRAELVAERDKFDSQLAELMPA